MDILEFFKNIAHDKFIPKTPFAAIKAFEAGILSIEHFIYKSTSTIPLGDENVSLEEIERIIANPHLDISANMLLIEILEKLINNIDMEIALFAAESINLIESRYNDKIEELKKKNSITHDTRISLEISLQYYELSLLNYKKESIRKFYLKEAYSYIKDAIQIKELDLEYIYLLIKILIELRQYENAVSIISSLDYKKDITLTFLLAEIEFKRRNYCRVFTILSELDSINEIKTEQGNLCSYWMDAQWIERSEYA